MPLFVTFATAFMELFLVFACAGMAAFAMREWLTRRSAALLLGAGFFAASSLSVLSFFIGHVLSANGYGAPAADVLRSALALSTVSGAFLVLAASQRATSRVIRALTIVLGLVVSVVGIVAVATGPATLAEANGVAFLQSTVSVAWWSFASTLLGSLCQILFRGGTSFRRGAAVFPSLERVFLFAGLSGVGFVLAVALAAAFWSSILVSLAFALAGVQALLVLTGIVADGHPDATVQSRPWTLFSRRLAFKAVILNAAVLWFLGFAVLSTASSLYVSKVASDRYAGASRDLHYFSRAFEVRRLTAMEDVNRLARRSDILSSGATSADVSAGQRGGVRIIHVIDSQGFILHSTYSVTDVGQLLASSPVVEAVLNGQEAAGIERDDSLGAWVIRAAAPLRGADGALVGAVVETDADSAFDFSDYAGVASRGTTGYGFVSASGEPVFSSGEPLDAAVLQELHRRILPAGIAEHANGGDRYFMRREVTSDGKASGFFYTFVSERALDAEAFRVIAVITLFASVALLFMVALMVLGMMVVLRPLRDLRFMVANLERGRYERRFAYESPDELGQLVAAFNRTIATVGERTAALKELTRDRRGFLEHAMRELRIPLNVFRWSLETLRFGESGRLNKEQMELLERLHQTNERLEQMLTNLQDVMEIDDGRLRTVAADFSAEDVVDDVAGLVSVESRRKDILFHWNRPAEPLPKVHADQTLVRKALSSLVGNAVKYTPKHGHVEVRVEPVQEASPGGRPGAFVQVTVEDNGIGIPTEDRPLVFSRFFRARNVTGFEVGGTGLGLYLAKRLIELQGGSVWLASREGAGTAIAFTLPVASSAQDGGSKT